MNDRNRKPPKSLSDTRDELEGIDENYSLDFTYSCFGVTICVKTWSEANNTPLISCSLVTEGEIDYHVDRLKEELERIRPRAKKALQRLVKIFPDRQVG